MRLFVGIKLPDEIKRGLLEFQSELRQLGVKGSWKSQENFHITLEFLGEIEPNNLSTLTETLSKGARNHNPFHLSIEGLGAFPSLRRPHTLWAAVRDNANALHQLREEIHFELANNGFVLEDRKFTPHITLASRPQFNQIDLSTVLTKKFGEFMVGEVILFESRAMSGKRVYTELYRTTLIINH